MNIYLILAITVAGLGFLVVLFILFKKAGKLAMKLPVDYLSILAIFLIIGLSGFLLKDQITMNPAMIALLVLIVSITAGMILITNLNSRWEQFGEKTFGRKLLYLLSILLTAILGFGLSFILSSHRGLPKGKLNNDLTWWLCVIPIAMLLPLLIKYMHDLWNRIPRVISKKPIFHLPLGAAPPFIESGGVSRQFQLVIPLDHHSQEMVQSRVAVPYNRTLAEVFHYKVHEHNIVKRFAKQITLAKDNQRSKIYGWCFYRTRKIWWGWRTKKIYLDPHSQVGSNIVNHESIFVERVILWDKKR